MSNELFIKNIDDSIRLTKQTSGEVLITFNDYVNDEFVIQTLSVEQARQLRDWLWLNADTEDKADIFENQIKEII